jgi:hypothetical protein
MEQLFTNSASLFASLFASFAVGAYVVWFFLRYRVQAAKYEAKATSDLEMARVSERLARS